MYIWYIYFRKLRKYLMLYPNKTHCDNLYNFQQSSKINNPKDIFNKNHYHY